MKNCAKSMMFLTVLLFLTALMCFAADKDDGPLLGNETPKPGADEPQVVYAKYAQAVHAGDLNTIKKLVYSKNWERLWSKKPGDMLIYTKNTVPTNLVLQSKEETQEYQYKYTYMKYTGTLKNRNYFGEVNMILEDGEWRVYQEKWRPL